MENIKLITKEEFEGFLKMQEHIFKLVKAKTVKLATIEKGRFPLGEICDFDIEESSFTKGCIHVAFEQYLCGETCIDSYELPFEFLYDPLYPVIYKVIYEEEQRKLSEKIERKEKESAEKVERMLEIHDKSEYERLKQKFEGS